MKRTTLIALLAIILVLPFAARADFKAGIDAFHEQDFATAFRELRPLAESGDADAQYWVGRMLDLGQGTERNSEEAAEWLHRAAVQGQDDAQFALGLLYEMGRGVEWSPAEAYRWIREAAARGNTHAIGYLPRGGLFL